MHFVEIILFIFNVSLTAPASESSTDNVSGSKQVSLSDDHVRSSESESPASGVASEQQLPDNKESSSSQNLDNYANVGLVRDTSPSYAPAQSQQQDSHDMPGFSVSEYCFYLFIPSTYATCVCFAFYWSFVLMFMFPNRLTTLPLVTIFLILDLTWMKLYAHRFFHHIRRYII